MSEYQYLDFLAVDRPLTARAMDNLYGEYQVDPLEKLCDAVADDGVLPDHYDQMTLAELRAFERMRHKFKKYLGECKQ